MEIISCFRNILAHKKSPASLLGFLHLLTLLAAIGELLANACELVSVTILEVLVVCRAAAPTGKRQAARCKRLVDDIHMST
ncbi:hypothetical protein CC207_20035 [Pseudomonas sp. DrBHI1]|nr:hypothetical protein CC207_20035 [Pseudomonas sp. DrBHI1]